MNNHTLLSDLGDFPNKGIRQFHQPAYDGTFAHQQRGMVETNPHPSQIIQQPAFDRETFNCRDISHHVDDCPICKKFYDSDTNNYVIIIIVLLMINLYLLRKLK